jgi:hypothetical protein
MSLCLLFFIAIAMEIATHHLNAPAKGGQRVAIVLQGKLASISSTLRRKAQMCRRIKIMF